MTYPLIGKTWSIPPERQTLREAQKRRAGRLLWFKCSWLNAQNAILAAMGVKRG